MGELAIVESSGDLRAQLHAAAMRRRASFGAVKEPLSKMVRVTGAKGVVRIVTREEYEAMCEAAAAAERARNMAIIAGFFTPERMMRDYCAKDGLYEEEYGGGLMCEASGYVAGVTVQKIAAAVAKARKVEITHILSHRRHTDFVRARHEIMWLAARHTKMSLPQIGRALDGRDHTTVLHGVRKFDARLKQGKVSRTVAIDEKGRAYAL